MKFNVAIYALLGSACAVAAEQVAPFSKMGEQMVGTFG